MRELAHLPLGALRGAGDAALELDDPLLDRLEDSAEVALVRGGVLVDQVADQPFVIFGPAARLAHRSAANPAGQTTFRQDRSAQAALDERDRKVPAFIACERHSRVEA